MDNTRDIAAVPLDLSSARWVDTGLQKEPESRDDGASPPGHPSLAMAPFAARQPSRTMTAAATAGQSDFEAISYDPESGHFFIAVEVGRPPALRAPTVRWLQAQTRAALGGSSPGNWTESGPFYPLIYELTSALQPAVRACRRCRRCRRRLT
jgi:hypothetical protein